MTSDASCICTAGLSNSERVVDSEPYRVSLKGKSLISCQHPVGATATVGLV